MSLVVSCDNCENFHTFPTLQAMLGPTGCLPPNWFVLTVTTPNAEGNGVVAAERHICDKHNRKLLEKKKLTEVIDGR